MFLAVIIEAFESMHHYYKIQNLRSYASENSFSKIAKICVEMLAHFVLVLQLVCFELVAAFFKVKFVTGFSPYGGIGYG